MSYERPNIQALHAYVPGEQPRTQRVIKLNTNENPYPPSSAVLEAIRAVTPESLRRYPSPRADRFRAIAAERHGVSSEQVIATNGGDELLRLAITVFCEPLSGESPFSREAQRSAASVKTRRQGDKETRRREEAEKGATPIYESDPQSSSVTQDSTLKTQDSRLKSCPGGLGVAEPSYSLYPVLAAIHGTPLLRVPLADDFLLPEDFADQLNAAGCRLAMVVNPHAPSGRREPVEKLERLARQFQGVLLIDEAYVDFAQSDALSLVRPGTGADNVLLLRSLSKGYSLAGLRFGYGVGAPGLIAALDKARDSYNTDVLAQAAACAALTHHDEAAATWQKVVAERQRVTETLRQRGWQVPDSETNFILATPAPFSREAQRSAAEQEGETRRQGGKEKGSEGFSRGSGGSGGESQDFPASQIYESLKAQGIFVRYFDQDRLRDKLRITIGTPEQNDALLQAVLSE